MHIESVNQLIPADPALREKLVQSLREAAPPGSSIVDSCVNASADSFYSSQGRQTTFDDHNESLIDHALSTVPNLKTLEMETFHLLHLAHVFRPANIPSDRILAPSPKVSPMVPPISLPVQHVTTETGAGRVSLTDKLNVSARGPKQGRIYACSAQMVFASRTTNDFITPELVRTLQEWGGRACMEALSSV